MFFLTSLSWIDISSKSNEKRSDTRVYLTCSPLQGAVLKAASRSLDNLGFPGNSSSRDAPSSIGVFSALALSFPALPVAGVWAVSSTALL